MSSSLFHIAHLPSRAEAHPPLLLLLHGLASNEEALFGLAPHVDERFVVVSARAPNTLWPGSYAWFNVQTDPWHPIINEEEAEGSRHALIDFVGEAVAEYGADAKRVYLLGFSQGAIMSASVALTRPDLVAGAVMLSGRILPEIGPLIAPPHALGGLPVMVVHGADDSVLPVEHGRASRDLLQKLPVRLDYCEYPMGHEIGPAALAGVTEWLRERLDEQAGGGDGQQRS